LRRRLDEREHDPQVRSGAGAQDRGQLGDESILVLEHEGDASPAVAAQEGRRLVGAEVERADGGDPPLERREQRCEHLVVLVRGRPAFAVEKRELGAHEPYALRATAQRRVDLRR
jgi:hypothetical protein